MHLLHSAEAGLERRHGNCKHLSLELCKQTLNSESRFHRLFREHPMKLNPGVCVYPTTPPALARVIMTDEVLLYGPDPLSSLLYTMEHTHSCSLTQRPLSAEQYSLHTTSSIIQSHFSKDTGGRERAHFTLKHYT